MRFTRFTANLLLLNVLLLLSFSHATDYELLSDETPPTQVSSLSLIDFQNLLYTEVNDEFKYMTSTEFAFDDDSMERKLLEDEKTSQMQLVWDQMLDHGWYLAERFSKNKGITTRRKLTPKATKEDSENPAKNQLLPFVVCSRTPLLHSGAQRLPPMIQFTGAQEKDTVIISNDDHQTCFYVATTFNKARFLDTAVSNDEYVILPLTDLMKISASTFEHVQSEEWSIPSPEQRFRSLLHGEESDADWERILRVTLATDRDPESNPKSLVRKGQAILNDIKTLGLEGSNARRRLSSNSTHMGEEVYSLTDTFSLTSSISLSSKTSHRVRALSSSRMNSFSRSLELGLEASHSCANMFENILMRPILEDNGLDIVLNPEMSVAMMHRLQEAGVESTASNSHCVASLIIGLSVHPQVLSIEADLPVTPDDFHSQWITQSNSPGRRPLFDSGLTGKGQIVSVTDSGLDYQNRFFGPTSDAIHQKWIMTERKVVRYDHDNAGDTNDMYQGHGTRVAGVIAGSLSNNEEHEADGVARDAKIHMWDIQKQGGGFSAPGPNKFFASIYNDGKGAKITNGSWSAGYKPYSTRCRMYDSSLRDNFDNMLFVASAGNTGNDVPGRAMNTIGEPASCKNTMAVGASQSNGERIYTGDLGKDHLADFSSRGPTMDGRMKPECVAVGYTILAPRAHASENNKEDSYETFGTSFSAPVVSGSAALIRQYFEEGWFPCGSKGCNKAIYPSGALVKAVLMNGAQSLKAVQKVPSGPVTSQLREYDNNQGMGLVNLSKSIPIKNVNQLNAVVVNNRALRDGETTTIVIKTKQCSANDLSVTISWYDPAGAANCAQCLVNDLDLSVQKNGQRFYPNGKSTPDRTNNSERVRMTVKAGQEIEITVKAHNLATESQKYSLIATGCFDLNSEKTTEGFVSC